MSAHRFELHRMGRKDLIAVFQELDAPAMHAMHGEFRGTILDQGHWPHNVLTMLAFNLPGVWISKSFVPVSSDRGQGYNSFRTGSQIRRKYPMQTSIRVSHIDGKPSFHLDYTAVNRWSLPSAVQLASELRQVNATAFLGMGLADFGLKALRRPQPFLLEGPVGQYHP